MADITQTEYGQQANIYSDDAAQSQPAPGSEEQVQHVPRILFPLLIVCGSVSSGLLFGLGYIARRMADNGTLAFTIRAENGWKYWLPGLVLAAVTGVVTMLC